MVGVEKYGYFNGKSIYKLSNGHVYEGEVLNGMKNGKGIFKYANGNIYEGEIILSWFNYYQENIYMIRSMARGNSY